MPKTTSKTLKISKNSIPNRNAASPKYGKDQYLSWYHSMLLIRKFEEKAGQLYGQQKIRGFCHLYIGQEACSAGAVSALEKGDKYISSYRDHAHPIALGMDPKFVLAELYGKSTGASKGRGGSMHMFDVETGFFGGHGIVGSQIPLSIGIAFADQYRGNNHCCICFLGDGAVRQGVFHESLNLAMTLRLPVVFAIENNGYAMGTSIERTSNVRELTKLALSYEMPALQVDGMKVEKVHEAVRESAQRARKGEGPTLLDLETYRYKGHSMSDAAKYRTREEVEQNKGKDPIDHTLDLIKRYKLASVSQIEKIQKQVADSISAAVTFSENSPFPSPEEVYDHTFQQKDFPFVEQ